MGIHHHAFNCKHIIRVFSTIFSMLLLSQSVYASNPLFIVQGVKVDVTAENSVAAQDKAYRKAQAIAFSVLADRMVSEAQANKVSNPGFDTVSTLVRDYEITNEQISAVRYVGTYTFRFNDSAVSKFFSVSGVEYTDQSSNTLLVLPIFQKNGQNTIWSQGNLWLDAWSNAHLSRGLVPVEVPIGDLMDIADIDDENALRYERVKLDRMLERYNAKEAAIMIAVPDIDLLNVRSDKQEAIGHLRISIYRTDRIKAEHVNDIILTANGSETREQLYARAVQDANQTLQKDWKSKTVTSIAQSQLYHARIPLKDLKQWVKAKNTLLRVGTLSDLTVLAMSKNEARVAFKFRGDEERLRSYLSRTAFQLGHGRQNPNAHGYTANGRNAPAMMYDLFYGGYKPQPVVPKKNDAPVPDEKIVPAAAGEAGQKQDPSRSFTF